MTETTEEDIPAGLTRSQFEILKRLREGALPCKQFEGLAASENTLKVQIRKIRVAGYGITTERESGKIKRGRPGVYRLVTEPTDTKES